MHRAHRRHATTQHVPFQFWPDDRNAKHRPIAFVARACKEHRLMNMFMRMVTTMWEVEMKRIKVRGKNVVTRNRLVHRLPSCKTVPFSLLFERVKAMRSIDMEPATFHSKATTHRVCEKSATQIKQWKKIPDNGKQYMWGFFSVSSARESFCRYGKMERMKGRNENLHSKQTNNKRNNSFITIFKRMAQS